MEPIAKRLKSFLQHKGLTTTAFTRILQYNSCEKVARLFRVPGAKPSVDILEDIAKHFEELNLRWLITGHGEMLRGSAATAASIAAAMSAAPAVQPQQETEMTAAIQQEHNPELLFIHTANSDEYIHHKSFPSFLLQSTGSDRVNLTHSETSKPLLGSLINFIENLRDEQ